MGYRGIPPLIPNLGTRWMLSSSCSGRFIPCKKSLHPLNMTQDRPHSGSRHFGEGKYLLPLLTFKPRIVKPSFCRHQVINFVPGLVTFHKTNLLSWWSHGLLTEIFSPPWIIIRIELCGWRIKFREIERFMKESAMKFSTFVPHSQPLPLPPWCHHPNNIWQEEENHEHHHYKILSNLPSPPSS